MGLVSNLKWLLRWPVLLMLPLCVLSVGCGSSVPTGTVKGNVTLDGEPYADAAVVFLSMESGAAGTADIQSGGSFTLTEPLPVGSYTVYLAPKTSDNMSEEATPVKVDEVVPPKYWNEADSDVKIEVAEGENDVTVELKKM